MSNWLAPILCTRRCESRINRYRRVLGPAERSGVGPRTRRPELRWRPVPQRAVRPDMVVLLLPGLPQHPRLQFAGELLRVEQLVPHLAVERLRVAVLPRRPGVDVQRLHAGPRHPGPDGPRDELRPVVRADVRRRPALPHYP